MLDTTQVRSEADYLFDLGVNCACGCGRDIDVIEAHKWFNLAASAGHPTARKAREDLALVMTSSQVARAQRQARSWLKGH